VLNRLLLAVIVAIAALVIPAADAWAADGTSTVACQQSTAPGCSVAAGTSTVIPASTASVRVQDGVTSGGTCTDYRDKPAPCTDPTWGWMGSNGCYWKVDTDYKPPLWSTADQHTGEAGAWFLFTCQGNFPGTGGGLVWLPTTGGPSAPLPPPEVLAQQAVNQLSLVAPRIETSPGGEQLVNLPTWLWLAQSAWAPMSATASVPGVSVTATASPSAVTWTLGDGTTLVCQGPGTPYAPGGDPSAPSPDCGHTYRQSSAGQPGQAYTVSAAVTWGVTWVGGGQSGSLPALTTTSTTTLRVAESQAINTSGAGA
jgi:hypothetical protein